MIGVGTLPPVIALAAWTMVMWAWMYWTRIPALSAAKVDPDALVRDPEKRLDKLLPPEVQWKATCTKRRRCSTRWRWRWCWRWRARETD